jgi:hypothetical protein
MQQSEAISELPIAVGERVGITYEIRGIREGDGECAVYDAVDTVLRRDVILKVTDREHRKRIVREAQLLAAVRHHGVPAVYGLGVHRGLPYLALERVLGVVLAEFMVERGRLALWFQIREVVPLLTSLAEAIAAIHGVGLAHGALGTRTVLVCRNDRVVLTGLTAAARHARGDDVRAFGALAYELLTEQPPRRGRVDAAAVRPDVPHLLADIVRQCIVDEAVVMEDVAAELRALPRARPTRRRPAWPVAIDDSVDGRKSA